MGTSDTSVTSPDSSVARTRSTSKRSCTTAVVWLITARTSTPRPPTWWSGSGHEPAVPGLRAQASREARALARWLPR